MLKRNCKYFVAKDIPLDRTGKTVIRKNSTLTRTEGVYYLDGIMLGRDLQEDFDKLIEQEERNGWKYIVPDNPIVGGMMPKKRR